MNINACQSLATACRWTARILGLLFVLFIVLIGIGEGMPNPFRQPLIIQVGFFALALIIIGMLVGWRWEIQGTLLSLVGFCLFIYPVHQSPRGMTWYVYTLALPGMLYAISGLLRRQGESPPSVQPGQEWNCPGVGPEDGSIHRDH
jgi:hypothetical protein